LATVDLGKISFTQKGTYDNSTSYAPKDVVQHTDQNETSSFVKISSTATGQVPQTNGTLNSSHWAIFAKGTSLATPNQGAYDASTTYSKGAVVQHTDTGVVSTFLYINTTPASGQTPSTGGTVNSSHWQLIAKGTDSVSLAWQSSVKTANFTALSGEGYFLDTTSNTITVTLPASPSVGDTIELVDYARNFGTNKMILALNSLKFQGSSTVTPEYTTNGTHVRCVYSGATKGWLATDDDDSASKVPIPAEYVVVAGGGSGGAGEGGGGGAGGFLTNFGGTAINLSAGVRYTITVGGGGAGVPGSPKNQGTTGSNSELSGDGITTVTANGGGGGGGNSQNGRDGGSGGGASNSDQGGSGTAGQGNDGGDGTRCGGGGAGAAAADGTETNGGNGLATSITGSSQTFAGGGGGGHGPTSGGSGGGTGGANNPNSSSAASANTGGGSGGANDVSSGNGGSGIVFLRVAAAQFTNNVTGSPTITDDGSDKVMKFTGSGSYTA
jgi:hypothetical protein